MPSSPVPTASQSDSDNKKTDTNTKKTDSDNKKTDSDNKKTDSDNKKTDSVNKKTDSDNKKTNPDKNEKKSSANESLKYMTEIHDFYVSRKLNSSAKEFIIVASHKRTDENDINSTEINYSMDRLQSQPIESRNGCTVRIPAMFWFRKIDQALLLDLIVSKGKFAGNNAVFKKQWGSHIFVNNGAEMQIIDCSLNEKHVYTADKPSSVNCVYPILRNYNMPTAKPDIVLGTRFDAKTDKKGDRSFGRDVDPKNNASGVWDITEDFLDPTSQSPNYMSEEFANERRRYALYVCEDTRLIVTDDRGSKNEDSVTQSFYQQGSLVVIEVEKGYELVVAPNFYAREKKPQSKEDITDNAKGELVPVKCNWKNLGKKGFVDKKWFHSALPEDEKDPKQPKNEANDKEGKNDRLSEQRRPVILLGATESQYNTVCWKIELSSGSEPEYILRPPDGGRIIDVQTWIKGFEQISARHKYQRLFEAVLYPEIHSKHPFCVPKDEKLLKRILGLCDCETSLNPIIIIDTSKQFKKQRHPQYMKPDVKCFHRMSYVEGVVTRDDWTAPHPYSVQPLHPPITEIENNEKNFFYLRYGIHPMTTSDGHYKIEDKEYEMFVKQIPEYSWKLVGRVHDFKEQFLKTHSKQHRIGIDWMVYETNFDRIGSIDSAIFYPKKEAQEEAEKENEKDKIKTIQSTPPK